MQFRYKLQYQLVKLLSCSNKEALAFIIIGRIKVNGITVSENILIEPSDKIELDDKCIREKKEHTYILYNKPAGIETTMNPEIKEGLSNVFNFEEDLYHIGRLDKESEGILLLSNDGSLGKSLLNKLNHVEKEYVVCVDKSVTNQFIEFICRGVSIMGKKTMPCKAEKINENSFKITLIEGMNRQIRRMCFKAGLNVTRLIRIRFADISDMPETGKYRLLTKEEIATLKGIRD